MKRPGFTLVESTIVLFIVALILALGTPQVVKSRQIATERQFFTRLASCWALETNRARQEKRRMSIYVHQHQMRIGNQILEMPKTLSADGFASLTVYPDGFVAPQRRVLFSSIDDSCYVMKIQMGWGGYHVEKQKAQQ